MKSREMKHRSDGIIVTAQWIVREPNEITSGVDTCRRFITRWNRIHIYIFPMLLLTNISNRFKGIEILLTLEIFIFYFYIIKKN